VCGVLLDQVPNLSHTPNTRMDVASRVAPEALIGRAVRVYWELDDAWFLGEIIGGCWGEGGRHVGVGGWS